MAQDQTRSSLELLLNISRELATTLDLKTVLDRVLFLSLENTGAERGSLIVLDDDREPLLGAIVHSGQPRSDTMEQLHEILDHGMAGWVLNNRQPVLIPNTSKDERWLQRPDDGRDKTGTKSAICVPLMARDKLVGVLTMVHPVPGYFNMDNFGLLQAISDIAGIAIHNALLYQSLEAAHQRYYELFENSIDPILISDWEGNILEANRQASLFSGFAVENLVHSNVLRLHDINPQQFKEYLDQLCAGETVRYESVVVTPMGAALPVEVYVRKINFEGVDLLQWILRDISQKKELDALREDLAAMIYHDLRSPLSNMISSLDILETMLPMESSPSLRSVFSITNRSAERMQRLISSLLDINRLESGQQITTRKTVNLLETAKEAVETVEPILESKQQTLNWNFPRKLPAISVDPDMLRRVLINLLENATKFTPMSGKLEIGGKVVDHGLTLWVRDSGPGIPPELHDYIFEKFTRIKSEHAPKGVGLGLAFCRLAVQAHGGKIWVESTPGEGSRFIFSLPLQPDE